MTTQAVHLQRDNNRDLSAMFSDDRFTGDAE